MRMKFHQRLEGGRWLARHLTDAVVATGLHRRVSVVTFVPLHPFRRLRRGFDQAEFLAREVARGLGLPLARYPIWRVKATDVQSASDPARRRANVLGAFRPGLRRRAVRGRSVLLIDDVFSTGSTVDAASQALLRAGARSVYVAVAAT